MTKAEAKEFLINNCTKIINQYENSLAPIKEELEYWNHQLEKAENDQEKRRISGIIWGYQEKYDDLQNTINLNKALIAFIED